MQQYVFFLGGADLEMETIRQLLREHKKAFVDHRLAWGASAAEYVSEIADAQREGKLPVLVELDVSNVQLCQPWLVVDHHGPMAGKDRPSSLEQVFGLLGLPQERWDRHLALVAANDRGHIKAMQCLTPPATDEEVRLIRQLDLAAQGVTADDVTLARKDAATAKNYARGRLTVVHTQSHRLGLVAELLEASLGGPGFSNLLIIGRGSFAFYGWGACVMLLVGKSPPAPSAWYGGSLPDAGFWGGQSSALQFDPLEELLHYLDAGIPGTSLESDLKSSGEA